MKKLKPALSVVGSLTMALTLASPTLAETSLPKEGSKVEVFKEDANAQEGKNPVYDTNDKIGKLMTENIDVQNNDWDNDGISNDLEKNGYKIEFNRKTGKNEALAWDSEKDKGKLKFISNPMSANSDGDPFTDMYEVENYNSNSDTDFNPIVANIPNLQIGLKRIEVIPIATITDNNGGSISRGWEKSVATQHSFNVGLTGTGGVEGSAAGPVPSGSVSANVGYGYSKTTTETESYTNNFDWSTATTVDTAKAAKVRVHLEYKNVGTSSAENVSPHFNIRLGNKIINTVKATQDRYKANYLSTEKGGRNKTEVVIDSLEGQADVNIFLSLDELKAVEQGELLAIEVLPTSTMDVSIEKDGEFMNLGDSGKYESRVNATTEELETDIGNKPKFRVYTPKGSRAEYPVLSYNEVFKHVNIDTNKVNNIVSKSTRNNSIEVVSSSNAASYGNTLENYKNNENVGLYTNAKHGAFENLQPPKLEESSYDPITKKIRATISPGLFGAKNEISASYETRQGSTKKVTLVRSGNGHIYESRENIPFGEFLPSNKVTFEVQDSQNKLPTNKISTVVKYNTEFDNYVVDNSGEFVVEGASYTIADNNPDQYKRYWGSHHASNKWEYLQSELSSSEKVNLVIERVGQPKPGQPIKKDEEVLIKFANPIYSDYNYLKLQDGYVHLDQKRNASNFKFNSAFDGPTYYRLFKIQSSGNYIEREYDNNYMKYGTGNGKNIWNLTRAQ
ncbi:binary toxin-like calcium binding domain-containing protein [Bacillus toyonensis]|uniref:binary toxin-like calcium binding domain-containing protein n=1 Tax=Bacillus toyonensis TaxID=155322 RepID=UPI0011A577FF|nr:binary toxin-like calcium binding domain-containing protein [Bacillus toyonensis]